MAGAENNLVLITNASEFTAYHTILQLQSAGYRVRGTVSKSVPDSTLKWLQQLGQADSTPPIEIMQAELQEEDCWKRAVNGCTYVIHRACEAPVGNPENEDDVLKPAVDGTLNVLQACRASRCVKRVIILSSISAISGLFSGGENHTEEDWTDVEKLGWFRFVKAITLAEKAAWNYVANLPKDERFDMVSLNPSIIMGPTLNTEVPQSVEMPLRVLRHDIPAVPHVFFSIVDVRDVALAHVTALTSSEAAGHRHILNGGSLWMQDIAKIIETEFKPQGYHIPTRTIPYFLIKISTFFDDRAKLILPFWGNITTFINRRMTDVLGIQPRTATETIHDTCYSFIEQGIVKKTDKFRGPYK